ncbi:MAG: S8 family peptidase [Acidobacteriota bacterium]
MALLSLVALSAATPTAAAPKSTNSTRIDAPASAQARALKRRAGKLDAALESRSKRQNGTSRVILEFVPGCNAGNSVRGLGGKLGRRLGILNGQVAEVPNWVLKRLADNPCIKAISDDRLATASNGRTAVTVGQRTVTDVLGYTGTGVGVAVIDSGITPWHDDLTVANRQGQRVAAFVDFVNGLTTPYDDWGHGTHVAGTIAGNGYDSYGTRKAMAPGAHIVALKALDAQGRGRISDIIAALDWAVANKAAYNIRVVNMSLGAGVFESYNTDPLTLAAKRAVDAGIVVVAAAGNLGKAANGQPQYGAITAPGNAPWVLTVGASSTQGTVRRQDDVIALYSSRGPTMYDFAVKPDLVAPGTGTVSLSDPTSRLYLERPQSLFSSVRQPAYKPYLALSGTSMAAPVVSGVVATMIQANPNLTPNLVKAILQFTAEVKSDYNYLTQGAGFLNALGAVRLSRYFATAQRGQKYPNMRAWSRHIFWGNRRVTGGVLTPGGTAWGQNIVWGADSTGTGDNIVWGEFCGTECDNIVWGSNVVWGNSDDDNIVWGNFDDDNIVWGNSWDDNIVWGNGDVDNIVWGLSDDNIVWGNSCDGADCDNIVWGSSDEDNIVWGNTDGIDNIVWGMSGDNIVWGTSTVDENISWGSSADEEHQDFGDDTAEIESIDLTLWEEFLPGVEPVDPLTDPSTTTDSTTTDPTSDPTLPGGTDTPPNDTTTEVGVL